MLIEALIAEAPIERLNGGVLIWLARLDQAERQTALVRPGEHGATTEFGAVVRTQDLRQAAALRQVIEHAGNGEPAEGASRHDGHGLVGRVIHHRPALYDAPVGRAIEDDVGGPDLVAPLRTKQGLPVDDGDLLPAAPFHLETSLGIQPVDPLVIDDVALLPQFQIDHAGAIAPVAMGQGDDAIAQARAWIRPRHVAQRRGTQRH